MRSGPTMHDVIAGVGYVMFWSSLVERRLTVARVELARRMGRDDSNVKERGLSPTIGDWIDLQVELRPGDEVHAHTLRKFKQSLESSIELRNAVAHGLESATGDPDTGEAWVKTVYGGAQTCRSLDHMLEAAYTFEMAARVVDSLTSIAAGEAEEHLAQSYDNIHRFMARRRHD